MPRGRWLVLAALAAVWILGSAINAHGPFGAHPSLGYAQFLADVEAGRVEQIVQWRDRLEVTEGSELFLVTVPGDVDVALDVGAARVRGGVGISFEGIPDNWLEGYTPWVPGLMLVLGLAFWLPAVVRGRVDRGSRSAEPVLP